MAKKLDNSKWGKTFHIKTYEDLRQYPLDLIRKAIQRFLYQEEYQKCYREKQKEAMKQYTGGKRKEKTIVPFPATSSSPLKKKVISALDNLGYKSTEVETAVEQSLATLRKQPSEEEAVKEAVRQALKILAKWK